jgi:hypothetical protein
MPWSFHLHTTLAKILLNSRYQSFACLHMCKIILTGRLPLGEGYHVASPIFALGNEASKTSARISRLILPTFKNIWSGDNNKGDYNR